MSQEQHAGLWASMNNLCMQMAALCYIAGDKAWANAFLVGVAISAIMALIHISAMPNPIHQ